jgi:hypothetical protein
MFSSRRKTIMCIVRRVSKPAGRRTASRKTNREMPISEDGREARGRMTPSNTSQHRVWRALPERIHERFFVRVKGRDAAGEKFKVTTILENISGGGLYVLLDREVEGGAPLSFFVNFSTLPPVEAANAPRLCARGRVLRAEAQPGGLCGVAVLFTRHRFF